MRKLLVLLLTPLLLAALAVPQSRRSGKVQQSGKVKVTTTAVGPAQFVSDTFTDTSGTDLVAHTPDVGGAWVEHPNWTLGGAAISNANRCRSAIHETGFHYNNAAAPDADYDVVAVIRRISAVGGMQVGVVGRMSSSATTWYEWGYDHNDGVWVLAKRVAGTFTELGTFVQTLSDGVDYTIKLEMRGTAIKGYVDSVQRASVTDSAVTAAGFAGIRTRSGVGGGSDAAGLHIDNFTATDAP